MGNEKKVTPAYLLHATEVNQRLSVGLRSKWDRILSFRPTEALSSSLSTHMINWSRITRNVRHLYF